MADKRTEREKQIDALREQVAKAESKGLFDTAHHQMLEQMLKGEKKEKTGVTANG